MALSEKARPREQEAETKQIKRQWAKDFICSKHEDEERVGSLREEKVGHGR